MHLYGVIMAWKERKREERERERVKKSRGDVLCMGYNSEKRSRDNVYDVLWHESTDKRDGENESEIFSLEGDFYMIIGRKYVWVLWNGERQSERERES